MQSDAAIIDDIFLILVKIDLLVFAIPKGIFSDVFDLFRLPLSDCLLIAVNRDIFAV